MKPDATQHNLDPAYIRQIAQDTGLTRKACADRLGMSERTFYRQLLSCSYCVQYCLEQLKIAPRTAQVMKNSPQDGTRWEYFGEYPIELGGVYYEPFLPCRAVSIKEKDSRTVQITVLRVSSWEPFVSEPLSSETFDHTSTNLEHYIRRRYLDD